MKYIQLLLLLSFSISIAQNPVVPIDAPRTSTVDGAYFKDLNNEFDKFVGTWVFNDGTNEFTVVLKKVNMIFNGTDYEDRIVGEYQYLVNGLELVNTLPNINNKNRARHNIKGRRIINNNMFIICKECEPGERRIDLTFYDRDRLYLNSSIILRYLLKESTPEKLQVTIYASDHSSRPSSDSPTTPRVPYGTYIMEKQ